MLGTAFHDPKMTMTAFSESDPAWLSSAGTRCWPSTDNLTETIWESQSKGQYSARLSDATFRFQLDRQALPLRELCDVAIRNNAERRFLFVSKVIGRHWPTRPGTLSGIATHLISMLPRGWHASPILFVGIAETATTLAQAVFREWTRQGGRGLYIESTRRRTGGDVAFEFSERHSHATRHAIHEPGRIEDPNDWFRTADNVVIVDDEATTGATAHALVLALKKYRKSSRQFQSTLAVILAWATDRPAAPDSPLRVVGIAEGNFSIDFEPSWCQGRPVQCPTDFGDIVRRGSRHGTTKAETLPLTWRLSVEMDEKILVLGQGEHGFRALLLAEHVEAHGAIAWVQATTRSPILVGGAISHIRVFPALSGAGHDEFLYNVPDNHGYDRVFLCMEDAPPSPDHPIRRVPRLEVLS